MLETWNGGSSNAGILEVVLGPIGTNSPFVAFNPIDSIQISRVLNSLSCFTLEQVIGPIIIVDGSSCTP